MNHLDYVHMNTILDCLTIDILTMYENNIKNQYVDYVERYVNVVWQKKLMTKLIRQIKKTKKEREQAVRNLTTQLRKIKLDLLNVDDVVLKSHPRYHRWIEKQRLLLIPQKEKFKKNSLYYDLQCHPQAYFVPMIRMMKTVESYGFSLSNPFPMRNEIIPKHIRLDITI